MGVELVPALPVVKKVSRALSKNLERVLFYAQKRKRLRVTKTMVVRSHAMSPIGTPHTPFYTYTYTYPILYTYIYLYIYLIYISIHLILYTFHLYTYTYPIVYTYTTILLYPLFLLLFTLHSLLPTNHQISNFLPLLPLPNLYTSYFIPPIVEE